MDGLSPYYSKESTIASTAAFSAGFGSSSSQTSQFDWDYFDSRLSQMKTNLQKDINTQISAQTAVLKKRLASWYGAPR